MIDRKYLSRIGLTADQQVLVMDARQKERKLIESALLAGVPSKYIFRIVDATSMDEVPDGDSVEVLAMRVAQEWSGFVPTKR